MKYAMVTETSGAKKRLKIATELRSIAATLAPTVAKRTNRKTRSRFNKSVIFTGRAHSSELRVLQVRQRGAAHWARGAARSRDTDFKTKTETLRNLLRTCKVAQNVILRGRKRPPKRFTLHRLHFREFVRARRCDEELARSAGGIVIG